MTRLEPLTRRGRATTIPALAALFAFVLVGLPISPLAPAAVNAATPDLTIVSSARYEVQPEAQRIRVTIDLTVHNRLRDTKTRRFYFDDAFLALIPGATGMQLSWTGRGTPSVQVAARSSSATTVRLRLGERLFTGQTARYRLRYDLPDPGTPPGRDLRVGASLVAFPVWAYASNDTPGSSVAVVVPVGYEARTEIGELGAPTVDAQGRTVFASGTLAKPLDFYAYVVADRPGTFRETSINATVGAAAASLRLRAWQDDPAWASRVGRLLERALPIIGRQVGLPWTRSAPLTIEESVSRTNGGYAGLFDPASGRVEIAYDATDFVVLHEAAHAWFNGALLTDRWANEAFASYYATSAAAAQGLAVVPPAAPAASDPARIPLNDWGTLGTASRATDDYAYAASLAFARAVAERAGPAAMRDVWAAVGSRRGAYQPGVRGTSSVADAPDAPNAPAAAPDWRELLDLLEDRTGTAFDDLWRTWVARPDDLVLLDVRAAARTSYQRLLVQTDGWHVPRTIRAALRAWRFVDAQMLMSEATAALDQRSAIQAAAATAGLTVPATMRDGFEDGDGFADTAQEGPAELAVIARYQAAAASATAVAPTQSGPLVSLGLWGSRPEVDLAAARDAFAAGDLRGAVDAADRAALVWTNAPGVGQDRAIRIGLTVLAAGLGLVVFGVAIRRRRSPLHPDPADADPAAPLVPPESPHA